MTARTGLTASPSQQTTAPPPALTDELAVRISGLSRRAVPGARRGSFGEVWVQSEASADGWIRCRVVEVATGFLALLASQSPAVGRGTWARVGGTEELEQVRVYPLSFHRLSEGVFLVECETPVDSGLAARLLGAGSGV